jgi:hypothetical protein
MSVHRAAEILAMVCLVLTSVRFFAVSGDILVDWMDGRIPSHRRILSRLWLPTSLFLIYVGVAITLLFS